MVKSSGQLRQEVADRAYKAYQAGTGPKPTTARINATTNKDLAIQRTAAATASPGTKMGPPPDTSKAGRQPGEAEGGFDTSVGAVKDGGGAAGSVQVDGMATGSGSGSLAGVTRAAHLAGLSVPSYITRQQVADRSFKAGIRATTKQINGTTAKVRARMAVRKGNV